MTQFPSIPLPAERPYDRIREFYLYQEPDLIAAIQRGDRSESVRILNQVLVLIYSAGEERSDLLKGLLLELVIMISRAAVEAGASASDVLGLNFRFLAELAEITDDAELAQWLRAAFERVFAAIQAQESFAPPLLMSQALRFMRHNLHREISRDDVARHAGLSASHFSRQVKQRTGLSFTELMRHVRVQHACNLLASTTLPLAEIAIDCGFCDQSYFTKVFQEMHGMTPRQFRERADRNKPTRELAYCGGVKF